MIAVVVSLVAVVLLVLVVVATGHAFDEPPGEFASS